MIRTCCVSIFLFAISAFGQLTLTAEPYFLSIPNADSLSTDWFLEISDSLDFGFAHPVDVDVIKLSPADYRVVFLDAHEELFRVFKIDQVNGLTGSDIVASGMLEDTTFHDATAMCQIRASEYFNPETDRIAVTFWAGDIMGIFKFNQWTNSLALEDTIGIHDVKRPIGIVRAFDQFFVVSEDSQAVYRLDDDGFILGRYGRQGLSASGYNWISGIEGYLQSSNDLHLYLCDGIYRRVDHLHALSSGNTIARVSQDWARSTDSSDYLLHEVALFPSEGLVGMNRFESTFYFWDDTDELSAATRSEFTWPDTASQPVHIWQLLGRLVVAYLPNSTDWVLRSYEVNSIPFDDPISYNDTLWTSAMSPIYVTDSIRIGAGEKLTINAGVTVKFDYRTAIVVDSGGTLEVNGSSSNEVSLENMNVGETWRGITVKKGSLSMDWVTVTDCDTVCIYTDSPANVQISNCTLSGANMALNTPVLRLWGSPGVTQTVENTVVDDVPTGVGLYLLNSNVKFQNVAITNCDRINSYINHSNGQFRECTFSGRTSVYAVLFSTSGTAPTFECCTFENLAPLSGSYTSTVVALSGTAPVFGYEGSSLACNEFKDSSVTLLKMYGASVLPIIDNPGGSGAGGHNDWYQYNSSGIYIYWNSPYPNPLVPYPAKEQYWNWTPVSINDFYPSNLNNFTLGTGESSPWGPCEGSSASHAPRGNEIAQRLDDEPSFFDSLFQVAVAYEASEEYESAQSIYRTIATSSDDYMLAWQAMTHCVSTQAFLDPVIGEAWIPALMDSLIAVDSSAYPTRVYGERLLASYRSARGEYEIALEALADLLDSDLTDEDSLLVLMDVLGIQMSAGLVDYQGVLDDRLLSRFPQSIIINTSLEAIRVNFDLVEQLGRISSDDEPEMSSAVPREFKLYQNYPNPFNPNTSIEFDLPERTQVNVAVYNTLGQVVAELLNTTMRPGHHSVIWSGKSGGGKDVATGLYIYRIHAGSFTDAKKMILLR